MSSNHFLSALALAWLAPVLAFVPASRASAATLMVTNCQDTGSGSLRDVVAHAASGDTVDMSTLACREIQLTSGAIEVAQYKLSLEGGHPGLMKVDAGRRSSVFRHSGNGTLHIERMNIANGIYSSDTAPLGGCLYSAGDVELIDSVVHGCRTRGIFRTVYGVGGAVYAKGAVKLVYSRVVDNIVLYGYAGAIFAGGGMAAFHSRICGNLVTRGGQIVFSGAGLFARYMSFCDNQGGGIWAQNGSIVIANSTISGNVGQSILFLGVRRITDTTSILDSTISGNTTPGGPIIDLQGNSPKSISNSTIAFNQQVGGCGPSHGTVSVMGPDAPTLLDSTIISDNLCNGATGYAITHLLPRDTVVGANNLIRGLSTLTLPADTITADPRLLPLTDNGGPTLTHALPADSPAIDAGNNHAGLDDDQRGPGFPRIKGIQVDIGAFER